MSARIRFSIAVRAHGLSARSSTSGAQLSRKLAASSVGEDGFEIVVADLSGAFLLYCPRARSRIYVEPTHLSRRAVRTPFAIMVPELNSQNATRYTVAVAERPKRSRGGWMPA